MSKKFSGSNRNKNSGQFGGKQNNRNRENNNPSGFLISNTRNTGELIEQPSHRGASSSDAHLQYSNNQVKKKEEALDVRKHDTLEMADNKNYKTKPCQYFANGFCRNGDHCKFSHGSGVNNTMKKETNAKFSGESEKSKDFSSATHMDRSGKSSGNMGYRGSNEMNNYKGESFGIRKTPQGARGSDRADNKYGPGHQKKQNFNSPVSSNFKRKVQTVDNAKNRIEAIMGKNSGQSSYFTEILKCQDALFVFLNGAKHQNDMELIFDMFLKLKAPGHMLNNHSALIQKILHSQFANNLAELVRIELSDDMTNGTVNVNLVEKLILFLKKMFDENQTLALKVLKVLVRNLEMVLNKLSAPNFKRSMINPKILQEFDCLTDLIKRRPKDIGKKFDENSPPDDFRTISIFPTNKDLSIETVDVFIRPNRSKGKYQSVDEYLDVQFRLMREDFIQPLRKGLKEFKENREKKRPEVRVYRNVFLKNCLPSESKGMVFNLSFDVSSLKQIKWSQSKRFQFGSILCLSMDGFETLIFATVAHRDDKELESGVITVKFCDVKPKLDIKYTMIESTILFEGYRHVLNRLQEMNESNFCMEKYIVSACKDVEMPSYLKRNPDLEYRFNGQSFVPGNQSWPGPVEFEMDDSQFRAFRSALTQEISIIQGPPGTGKTYIGLKICQCLLENVRNSPNESFGPFLVVCYTNHALDQFLEGISKFTQKIVRIGNRSKSDKIKAYSILNWKSKSKFEDIRSVKDELFGKLKTLKEEIVKTQAIIQNSYENLLSLDDLENFIREPEHFHHLQTVKLINWLLKESRTFDNEDKKGINASEEVNKAICLSYAVDDNEDDEDEDDGDVYFVNTRRRLDVDEDDIDKAKELFSNALRIIQSKYNKDDVESVENSPRKRDKIRNFLKDKFNAIKEMSTDEAKEVNSLEKLNAGDRWRLYKYWWSLYLDSVESRSKEMEMEFEDLNKRLKELHYNEDYLIMMEQDIIGMTTTGAARYGKILEEIKCKIIIVEEAAEVLESHVIASLNSGCQQLILIGDHKQLRPNPCVYDLAKKYDLEISFFERLVNNNFHLDILELQHRMRPEIAEIMKKFIYEDLQNDPSVLHYPNVPAITSNLYFFNHSHPEIQNKEILSFSNVFEAEFILKFCQYLMLNGIDGSKITILTMYSGQLFLLNNLKSDRGLNNVRISVVDSFQGEENDIILLSLVRSKKIGFLDIQNRICVSLSRAKYGLYVFGNFQLLIDNNDLWKKICHFMKDKELLGSELHFKCRNHPEKEFSVKKPDEFEQYPEGGCDKLCNEQLDCGHSCKRMCHILDRSHSNLKCIENCVKCCPNGHQCNLKCFEKCAKCISPVSKVIPGCCHEQLVPCSKDPVASDCSHICERMLSCGHKCLKLCKESCGDCLTKVTRTCEDCGHEDMYNCSDINFSCIKPCDGVLGCGHKCTGNCGTCNNGRLHIACTTKCNVQLLCGHECADFCSQYCSPCKKKCFSGCAHLHCEKICGTECLPCIKKCKWKCPHKKCSKKCFDICDREYCDEDCEKILQCKTCNNDFKCFAVCGEPHNKRCSSCEPNLKSFSSSEIAEIKFLTLWTCKHTFDVTYLDEYMSNKDVRREICYKTCPTCKCPINKRSCLRYSNYVREIEDDLKEIYNMSINKYVYAIEIAIKSSFYLASEQVCILFKSYNVKNYFDRLKSENDQLHFSVLEKYDTTYYLLHKIKKHLHSEVLALKDDSSLELDHIKLSIGKMIKWLDPDLRNFTSFEINQFIAEFERISIMTRTVQYPEMFEKLKRITNFSGSQANDFKDTLIEFLNVNDNDGILKDTKVDFSSVPIPSKFPKGKWYKCNEGHFFHENKATDYGCPECVSRK